MSHYATALVVAHFLSADRSAMHLSRGPFKRCLLSLLLTFYTHGIHGPVDIVQSATWLCHFQCASSDTGAWYADLLSSCAFVFVYVHVKTAFLCVLCSATTLYPTELVTFIATTTFACGVWPRFPHRQRADRKYIRLY